MQSGAATRGSVALAATHLPGGEGVVLNQDDEGATAMSFDPPEEYVSQERQDLEEWDGTCGCSFGPNTKPSGPYSALDELQYGLWDEGIRCEVTLVEKKDKAGSYTSARLVGDYRDKLLARPIVQQWINAYAQKHTAQKKQL
jgi:hypothetical protein